MKIIMKFKDGTLVESQKNGLDVRTTEDMLNLLLDSKKGSTKISIDGDQKIRNYDDIYSIEVVLLDPKDVFKSSYVRNEVVEK